VLCLQLAYCTRYQFLLRILRIVRGNSDLRAVGASPAITLFYVPLAVSVKWTAFQAA